MSDSTPPKVRAKITQIEASAADKQIDQLVKQVEKERNSRREERFGWILVSIIGIDMVAFSFIPNLTGPLVIGILELVGLTVLAKRLGVDEVLPALDRLLATLSGKLKP